MKLTPESAELITVFDYIRLKHYDKFIWHCPNEGKRSKVGGALLKRQGLMAGVSDICIAKQARGYGFAFIELKAKQANGRYRVATMEQLEFLNRMKLNGYFATIANGASECIDVIDWYLK